ncbi:MAG: PaaI family thioesterase [Sphingobium sp.]
MKTLPYAVRLGITHHRDSRGAPYCTMPPGLHVEGRTSYLHGGAIAGLLEIASYVAMEYALEADETGEVKPISVSVDYMRNGNMVETFAQGRLLRIGSRIANVTAEAWQDDRERPIAMARMLFSLRR